MVERGTCGQGSLLVWRFLLIGNALALVILSATTSGGGDGVAHEPCAVRLTAREDWSRASSGLARAFEPVQRNVKHTCTETRLAIGQVVLPFPAKTFIEPQ